MADSKIIPETTLAIILGASVFPKTGGALVASPSFRKSAEDFRDYLLSPDFFDLPESNLLYLFDDVGSVSNIDEMVVRFLVEKIGTSNPSDNSITDVLVYYVGHGGFENGGSDYYLALADTRKNNELMTSYSINGFAKTLKSHSRNARRYVILDCCFAGAAFNAFMSSAPGEVASRKTSLAFQGPTKGTALLCASSSHNPAMAPEGEIHTMFSGAMLEVLHSSVALTTAQLSFRDLQQLIENKIRDKYHDSAVRPEIHDPNQPLGVIGDIPFFPNPYIKKKIQQQRIERIENLVSILTSQQKSFDHFIIEIQKSLGELQEAQKKVTNTSRDNPELGGAKHRQRRFGRYFVSEPDWNSIPVDVKKRIRTMAQLFANSWLWIILCLFVSGINWFDWRYFQSNNYGLFFIILELFLGIAGAYALIKKQEHRLSFVATDRLDQKWMHLDVVLALDSVNACHVLPHFYVDRKAISMTSVFMIPSTLLSIIFFIKTYSMGKL